MTILPFTIFILLPIKSHHFIAPQSLIQNWKGFISSKIKSLHKWELKLYNKSTFLKKNKIEKARLIKVTSQLNHVFGFLGLIEMMMGFTHSHRPFYLLAPLTLFSLTSCVLFESIPCKILTLSLTLTLKSSILKLERGCSSCNPFSLF